MLTRDLEILNNMIDKVIAKDKTPLCHGHTFVTNLEAAAKACVINFAMAVGVT